MGFGEAALPAPNNASPRIAERSSPSLPLRRRVSGLRREELALLAGVSVSYYTRLEQGQSVNASVAILDALARALRLDEHERRHLGELAAQRPQPQRRPPLERLTPLTRDL
jgi:transcriptional regulator with XRE-family HTH domain